MAWRSRMPLVGAIALAIVVLLVLVIVGADGGSVDIGTRGSSTSTVDSLEPDAAATATTETSARDEPPATTGTTSATSPSSGEDPRFIRAYGDGFGVRVGLPQGAHDDEPAGFGLEAYWRPEAPLDAVDIDFGDGTVAHFDAPCVHDDHAWSEPFDHASADPDTYEVRVTATTGPRCLAGAPVRVATATGHVVVGDLVSNGPALPTATVDAEHANDDGTITYVVTVGDADGWVDDVWVTFTKPEDAHHELWGFGDECLSSKARGETGFPSSSRQFSVTHDFTGDSRSFHVEVHSRGCDAEHEQMRTQDFTEDVP